MNEYYQPPPKRRVWPWILLGSTLVIVFAFVACSAFVATAVSTAPGISSYQPDPVVPNPAPDPNAFGQGTYEVPQDMPVGKYKTSGNAGSIGCGYFIKDTTDINYSKGPLVFTVKNGQIVSLTGDCTWIKQ